MQTLMEYKCPNCAGAVQFDPTSQQMNCPFCDSEFCPAALKERDDALENEPEAVDWASHDDAEWAEGEEAGMRLYSCNSCAGEIIADESTAATHCPYCDNPVIMVGQLSGSAKPDLIIPFKLDKKAAIEALQKHLSGKKLLPKCFKTTKHLEEIKGLYVPFWLFDADIDANMRYKTTSVRTWSDSRFIYTETRHFNVVRQGEMAFDAVPVDASAKLAADLMESIEPFDASTALDFQTAYLAGYLADKFDFCEKHCIDRANERIRASTEDAFRKTVTGYATVTPEYRGVYLRKSEVKYALLPVWVLYTKWRGQDFLFAMNGQTGKFVGDLPTDWGIFWKWFFIWAFIIGIVLYGLRWVVA
ncbi:MAG: IBR domain-containing protein [Defluviitaleaceae bacterium]|nr:IBR domain-containing protein [Defluviitaleaceae bacterium]